VAEYTAKCAARDTRRAIARVEKAIEQLRACAVHWGDLNGYVEGSLGGIEMPEDILRLKADLEEEYPTRSRATVHK
jgi:hypothetical protein